MTSGKEQPDSQMPEYSPFPEAMRYLGITLVVSALLATLFTAWTPASLNPAEIVGNLLSKVVGSEITSPVETEEVDVVIEDQPVKVGIIAGHSGPNIDTGLADPGATCDDGLTELDVNLDIANFVVRGLEAVDIEVDLLEEFDSRLVEYRADALVSIHADACYYINDEATGYKVSRSVVSDVPEAAERLVNCLIDRYGRATGLQFHAGSITVDMTDYHTFYEIHGDTPAAIIETGFLYLDREFLTEHPEDAARGIVDGILCYLNRESVDLFEDNLQ
jgi:N-acetylmuramoyl-L-alanine amidase